ncbi:MAG TPA: glycosyltransferase family 4 protein [Chiayiivirga sp.]|nr:glycosyltransferase family 4 protein [Chiayiivirga sp.]
MPEQKTAPPRVLMVVPQFPYPVVGGLEKQSRLLSEELVLQGCKVRVLSGRITPDQPAFASEDGIEIHRLPWPRHRLVRWLTAPWSFAATFVRLARASDVVHCHVLSGVCALAIMLAGLCRRPIMVKLPGVGAFGIPGIRAGRLGALRLYLLRRADAIVAMSMQSVNELAGIDFPHDCTLVTPNGICLSRLSAGDDAPTIGEVPSSSGRVDAGCRLLFVGRLDPQKGLPDLLQALQGVMRGAAPCVVTLDIAGDGEERARIEAMVQSLGLGTCVRLLGHVEGIPERMPDYDALVLPSYGEGNSNVILEAMAAGLPVISTHVGGTPMLVGATGVRLLHAPGDVGALAHLIAEVARDAHFRCSMGDAMRARAQQLFDIRVIAQRYRAAYALLAQRQRNAMLDLACAEILAEAPEAGPSPCAG